MLRHTEPIVSDNQIISALKASYKTDDVKAADVIFDGEHSFIIDDKKYVTVFESEIEMEKFYKSALKSNDVGAAIDFMDRYLGKGIWKKYIDVDSLRDFIQNAAKGKDIGYEIKYKINHDPVGSLNLFFPNKTLADRLTIKNILIKFCKKELFVDALESAFLQIDSRLLYIPETDSYLKAYDWSPKDEENI